MEEKIMRVLQRLLVLIVLVLITIVLVPDEKIDKAVKSIANFTFDFLGLDPVAKTSIKQPEKQTGKTIKNPSSQSSIFKAKDNEMAETSVINPANTGNTGNNLFMMTPSPEPAKIVQTDSAPMTLQKQSTNVSVPVNSSVAMASAGNSIWQNTAHSLVPGQDDLIYHHAKGEIVVAPWNKEEYNMVVKSDATLVNGEFNYNSYVVDPALVKYASSGK